MGYRNRTGKCIKTLEGHAGSVWSIAVNPISTTIASSSHDDTIKIWDIITGKCLKTFRHKRPYENMNVTGVKGLTDAEISTLKALGAVEDEKS